MSEAPYLKSRASEDRDGEDATRRELIDLCGSIQARLTAWQSTRNAQSELPDTISILRNYLIENESGIELGLLDRIVYEERDCLPDDIIQQLDQLHYLCMKYLWKHFEDSRIDEATLKVDASHNSEVFAPATVATRSGIFMNLGEKILFCFQFSKLSTISDLKILIENAIYFFPIIILLNVTRPKVIKISEENERLRSAIGKLEAELQAQREWAFGFLRDVA